MQSFDRLADMLDTDGEPMVDNADSGHDKMKEPSAPIVASGENKAPAKGGFKKTVKRKHKMRSSDATTTGQSTKNSVQKERPKPKFFCEF